MSTSAPPADPTRAERLRRWVLVVGIVVIVANATSAAYDQWSSYRQTLADSSRELTNVARTLAEQIASTVRAIDVLLRDTADWYREVGATLAPGSMDAALAARAEGLPQLLSLTITGADGVQQYRSHVQLVKGPLDVSDRFYFRAHRDNPSVGLFVSEPIQMRTLTRTSILLSRRLSDGAGRFAGVVTGFIDLAELQKFYREINLGTHSAILLIHAESMLAVHEPPKPQYTGKPLPQVAGLAQIPGGSAALLTYPVDGSEWLVAVVPSPGFPLLVGVSREAAAIFGPWRAEASRVAVRTLVFSALVGIALAALVHQLRRVEWGERALRLSEERYAMAMDVANEGHFDLDPEGGSPPFVSPKMRALLGIGEDARITDLVDLKAHVDVHPDDQPRIGPVMRDHLKGRTERLEIEYRVRWGDGEWHWLLLRGRCLRDACGKPCRFVGTAMDVTARKLAEAEKERLELQLRKSQKIEAIGTLAGGIAHDFNNILGAILGYGEMSQKSVPEGSVLRRYLDNVMHGGGRAKALVERILAFSRSGLGQREAVNVQAVIEETLALLAASLPDRVRLEQKLDAGDAAVIGDATELHQVTMNLCTNAVQAMGAGGVLDVRLEHAEGAGRTVVSHGAIQPGSHVLLTVRDSGVGMKPDVLDRIFDPFFTTKGVGEGTGLGLSLVHGIVADMGGAIDVATAPGVGTTFAVWLPVSGSAPRAASEAADELPLGNGEVVMVVDDEPPLVELAEDMLLQLGYEPACFHSSTTAVQAFACAPGRFDIVLTDEMMPELTGTGLAREIRRLRDDIPILLMTGYSDSSVIALARSAGVSEVLRKPLEEREIAESLARVLPGSAVTPSADL